MPMYKQKVVIEM